MPDPKERSTRSENRTCDRKARHFRPGRPREASRFERRLEGVCPALFSISSRAAWRPGCRLHPFGRLQEDDPVEMLARHEMKDAHLVGARPQVGAAGEIDEQSVLAQGVEPVFDRSRPGFAHLTNTTEAVELGAVGG